MRVKIKIVFTTELELDDDENLRQFEEDPKGWVEEDPIECLDNHSTRLESVEILR